MTAIDTEFYSRLAEKYKGYGRNDKSMEEWQDTKVEISEKDLFWLTAGLKYGCRQIREQREYIQDLQDKLKNSDSIESMTKALELHYKCVVRPVIEYCNAFDDWIKVCQEAHKEYEEELKKYEAGERKYSPPGPPPLWEIRDYLWKLRSLDIGKSDYLRRRIYAKEGHRTEKCPIHKGRWSGLKWSEDYRQEGCLCQDPDGNVSGWIPLDE